MGRRTAGVALASIAALVAAEMFWDMAHGSAGTHWMLKVAVIAAALVGIALLRLWPGSAAHRRGAASPPRPRPEDGDPD